MARVNNAHRRRYRTDLLIMGVLAHGYFPANDHANYPAMAAELLDDMRKLGMADLLEAEVRKYRSTLIIMAMAHGYSPAKDRANYPAMAAELLDDMRTLGITAELLDNMRKLGITAELLDDMRKLLDDMRTLGITAELLDNTRKLGITAELLDNMRKLGITAELLGERALSQDYVANILREAFTLLHERPRTSRGIDRGTAAGDDAPGLI